MALGDVSVSVGAAAAGQGQPVVLKAIVTTGSSTTGFDSVAFAFGLLIQCWRAAER
jgi:hypothetical protein